MSWARGHLGARKPLRGTALLRERARADADMCS